MSVETESKERLEQWLLRSAIAFAVFFGGKWVGQVDKMVEKSPAGYERLSAVEVAAKELKGTMAHSLKLQETMLTNQLEMNQFIAREYGNKELAEKFKEQLRVVKEEKQERSDAPRP